MGAGQLKPSSLEYLRIFPRPGEEIGFLGGDGIKIAKIV